MKMSSDKKDSKKAKVDYTDPKQYNPQNDPDVERGYHQHQKQIKKDRNRNYNVDESGGTVKNP